MIFLPITLALAAGTAGFNAHVQSNDEIVSALVRNFEPSEVPTFYQIMKCESTWRQWDSHGVVLTHVNGDGTLDYGIMQINSSHLKEADDMGLDIFNSLDDNVRMSRYVYDHQGYGAWKKCASDLGLI